MKKTYLYIGTLLFMLVFWASCTKDDLEVTPSQENQASYYQYDEQIEAASWACYSGLKVIDRWGWTQISWGNFTSDDAHAGGESDNDQPGYHSADYFRCTPNDMGGNLGNMWSNTWKGINKCNNLITYIKSVKEKDFHRQAVAEAKVLKALYYFYLARMFGGLPIFDKAPVPSDAITRASQEETYAAIERWLKEAIEAKSIDGSKPALTNIKSERISLDAAKALLGKVLIYEASLFNKKDKYSEAITYLSQVNKELTVKFPDIFESDFNDESIFEVNYTKVLGAGNTYYGNYEIQLYGIRSGDVQINENIGCGWGFNQPSKDLVAAFQSQNDIIRLNATVISSDSAQKLHDKFKPNDVISWVNEISGYWDRKHIPNPTKRGPSWQTFENNNILLRMADVKLLLAEAYNRTGNDNNARIELNKVRARVNLPEVTSSGEELYAAIKLERRLELALEGERYFDLVRWGDAASVLGPIGYNETSGPGIATKGLFPIPQGEINRNSGANNLTQNPGY